MENIDELDKIDELQKKPIPQKKIAKK